MAQFSSPKRFLGVRLIISSSALLVCIGCAGFRGNDFEPEPLRSASISGIFSKREFMRLGNFGDGIYSVHSFQTTNLLAVQGWSMGGLVDPESGAIKRQFTLKKRTPAIVHTEKGFLLLYTGGFSEIFVSDLLGQVLWEYGGRFAEAYPLYEGNDVHYCIAHFVPGDDGAARFLILDSKFQTIYADDTISGGITTKCRGDASVCQLAEEGTTKQSLIVRSFEGGIVKQVPLKEDYYGILAYGWPKDGLAIVHTKRGIALLDENGLERKRTMVLPWGTIIMRTDAAFYESGAKTYLAVLLIHPHASGADFSTLVILDEELNEVLNTRIPECLGITSYHAPGEAPRILVPGLPNVIFEFTTAAARREIAGRGLP